MSKIITAFERAIWTNIARSTSVNHERVQKERQVFFEAAVKVVKAGAIAKAKTKMNEIYYETSSRIFSMANYVYIHGQRDRTQSRENQEREKERARQKTVGTRRTLMRAM